MKHALIIPTLLLIAAACFGGQKEKAFEESFLHAVSTGDEEMLKLVEFSRSTPRIFRDMIVQSLSEDRTKKIEAITFVDPPESAVFEFDYEDVTYTTSLPVVKEMRITYNMTDDTSGVAGTTYRLGIRDGKYKIVAPVPQKANSYQPAT